MRIRFILPKLPSIPTHIGSGPKPKTTRGIPETLFGLFGLLVFVVIATNLLPTIVTTVNGVQQQNVTSSAGTLIGLIPLIFTATALIGMINIFR